MDKLDNYMPSGWKRDLLHIVGCYYSDKIDSLDSCRWERDSQKFLWVMKAHKDKEWLAIKELKPLKYMSYVAEVFHDVTGHYLEELSGYTGWIQAGGYYHWKVKQGKQLRHCPHLRGSQCLKDLWSGLAQGSSHSRCMDLTNPLPRPPVPPDKTKVRDQPPQKH